MNETTITIGDKVEVIEWMTNARRRPYQGRTYSGTVVAKAATMVSILTKAGRREIAMVGWCRKVS